MKFLVQFHPKHNGKQKLLEAFEVRGPNKNPGVTLKVAWIAKNEETVFALVESDDEKLVVDAARSWTTSGDYQITPVIDWEQY